MKRRHELLKNLRISLRLSYSEVCRVTTVDRVTLRAVERKNHNPNEDTLLKLYSYYGRELKRQLAKLNELESDLIAAGAVNGGRSASAR